MFTTKTVIIIIVIINVGHLMVAKTSATLDLFCNRNRSDLSIDAALSELPRNQQPMVKLFIGDQYYEFWIVNASRLRFSGQKPLASIVTSGSAVVRAPINISFYMDDNYEEFRLINTITGQMWNIFRNGTLNREVINNKEIYTFEAIRTTKDVRLVHYLVYHRTDPKIFVSTYDYKEKYVLRTMIDSSDGQQMVRLVNASTPDKETVNMLPVYRLNGQLPTAAFVYRYWWHVFAGRWWCRMKVFKLKWSPFCQIKDISELIGDCTDNAAIITTQTTTTSSTTTTTTPSTTQTTPSTTSTTIQTTPSTTSTTIQTTPSTTSTTIQTTPSTTSTTTTTIKTSSSTTSSTTTTTSSTPSTTTTGLTSTEDNTPPPSLPTTVDSMSTDDITTKTIADTNTDIDKSTEKPGSDDDDSTKTFIYVIVVILAIILIAWALVGIGILAGYKFSNTVVQKSDQKAPLTTEAESTMRSHSALSVMTVNSNTGSVNQ
ncbi:uncharacterized protein LOC128954699 [Oppia nitens]|uniref:uncharacterized protein LOC128954699 n=1 Tax=Oppia nitens TaxID=1686743 RepID=UPI0023DA59B0|nr:uncharacterized protein LOC128954699 [Oppia nitens]